MKSIGYPLALALTALAAFSTRPAQAQSASIAGTYEQKAFVAPDRVKGGESDLVIEKEAAPSKKIWIRNLVAGAKVYAVAFSKMDDVAVYKIPAQTVNGYVVQSGCVTYDKGEQSVSISINNKINCFGMSQSDYDAPVSVSKNGTVKAGGVQVGKNGRVSAGGVNVDKGGVRVDAKAAMAGIQYMGQRKGADD